MFDPAARTLTYARAGHNPPLLYNKQRQPAHWKLESGGMMLGMAPGALFDRSMVPETLQLQTGDVILFYTDGLEEAKNDKSELFGLARVTPILSTTRTGRRPTSSARWPSSWSGSAACCPRRTTSPRSASRSCDPRPGALRFLKFDVPLPAS